MHILVVSTSLPGSGGGANTRNFYLLRSLASKHRISLLAYAGQDELENTAVLQQLRELTHSLKIVEYIRTTSQTKRRQQLLSALQGKSYILQTYMVEGIQQALDEIISNATIDVVLFESVLLAGYQLPSSVSSVIDQHNIEHEILDRTYQGEKGILRRWYNRHESQQLKPVELERCRRADAVVVTSDREQQILQKYLPTQAISTVPNGVDIEMFQQAAGAENQEIPGRIVFTGTMNYYPNTQAALYFARHCWPRIREEVPNATWQIVGKEPPQEIRALAQLPGVEVTGEVPDVRPYLAQAEVTLAPLQIGSGTRLKILEALAMEKAMVSTSIGCEGIAVKGNEHLLIANEPEAFTRAVIELLHSPEQRRKMGAAGRALVEQQYSWQQCGERLLDVLDRLNEKERIC
jgi:sugar transferase (PEP-CTERM/EpsH1 system associated)